MMSLVGMELMSIYLEDRIKLPA